MDQQEMAQLLAERLGVTTEENAALESGDFSSLIANRVSDPLMANLLTSIMSQSAASSEPPERLVDQEHALARAKLMIRELKKDLAAADSMIAYIAEIFGACAACWGQSRYCSRCAGNGKPGSAPPMETELLAWVNPALKRMGMKAVRIQ